MSFQGKYEILSTLSEGEAKSFRAKRVPSGRPVILHHLAASRPATAQPDLATLIFEFLRTASKEASRNFLDMGDEEGRIFIVTADVPECHDLRKWLQAGIGEAGARDAESGSAAAAGPDPRNIQLTRNFTTEALRQLARAALGEPAPASPSLRAALRTATAVETNPGEKISAPESSSQQASAEPRPTILFPVSEETSPAGIAGYSNEPAALKESLAAQMTAEFPSPQQAAAGKRSGSDPGSKLLSKTAQIESAPDLEATAAGVNSTLPLNAAPLLASPQGNVAPQISKLLADAEGPPHKTVLLSSTADDRKPQDLKPPENPAPRKPSLGFEMVFQSNKPRMHPTLSGAEGAGILDNPFGPATEREEGMSPTPTVPGEPLDGLPAGTPPAGPRKATGTMFDMPVSRTSSTGTTGSRAWQAPLELEKGTRPSATPGVGSYTRMIENVKSLAGPLAPESPPSGGKPGSAPSQGSYLPMPSSYPPSGRDSAPRPGPSQYHLHEGDSLPPPQKRKVWVPIVILGILFLMTVAVLVYFALK